MLKLNSKRNISINKVCRACLTERGHLREIFSTKIPRMLESIASVQISEGDGLPPNICITCFHLIAKCYTFKKKIERNDKYMRSHCKAAEKDILDIAFNDAQINPENDTSVSLESDTSIVTEDNTPDIPQDNINVEDICSPKNIKEASFESSEITDTSTVGIPLEKSTTSNEKTSRSPRKTKSKANKIINALMKEHRESQKVHAALKNQVSDCESEKQDVKVLDIFDENFAGNNSCSSVTSQVFTHEPPPLVPLELKTEENIKTEPAIALPVDTPPLIPIKPIVNPETILTLMKEPVDLKLTCSSCNEEFSTIEALKTHKLSDCQISNLQCNICKKEFKESKKLIGHLKGHMIVKDYGCKICGKKYPNPSTFKVHMRTHTGERPFKCETCGKGFIRWAGVAGHMKTHQTHKPYKCPTCGKGFKISSNLERHKILHTGIMPYCCNYCGKTFSQSDNLQLHIRTYHTNERPYLCNECGKGFVSSTRLNRHMWIHTGYKPYLCKTCPKAYSNSNDLKIHEKTHANSAVENDKPYSCKVCNMRFYHPCRLSKHMKTHERPHACLACPRTFSCNRLLHKHMNAKHSNVDAGEVQFVQEVVIDNDNVFIEYDACQI